MRNDTVIAAVRKSRAGQSLTPDFIFPSLSCVLAASRLHQGAAPLVSFSEKCQSYADQSGLIHALAGRYENMVRPRSITEGQTWSHVTTLYQDAEVEQCNQTINDLLFAQLGGVARFVVDQTARVVGELHDNVASHACGRGFSAAQFYRAGPHSSARLEIAIADAGMGLLKNVSRAIPTIDTSAEAITWCLQKGNTTWRPPLPGLPDPTSWADPYAEEADRSGQHNHHMGWGLWLLTELIRRTGGSLWIWTGDASYTLNNTGVSRVVSRCLPWQGVVIEITLFPDRVHAVDTDPGLATLQRLAEELGL